MSSLVGTWKRYLLWFAHELVDFRHAEIQSILSMYNIPMRWVEEPSEEKPYCIIDFPSEKCVHQIAARSVSVKNFIELWSSAASIPQLHDNLKQFTSEILISTKKQNTENSNLKNVDKKNGERTLEQYFTETFSFKIHVETFSKHFTLPEKVKKIETFEYMPLKGPIRLKNPDVELMYLEYYGSDPNNVPEEPVNVFFGRWVVDGQRTLMKKLSLKTRKFIGNTSMDPQLSLLMANQARVHAGHSVLDPFVGSGSLLVAAAEFGGHVWGSDLDYMMIHGRTRPSRVTQKVREDDESIRANMRQYRKEDKYLDVVVSDFSLPLWRDDFKLDAIITDPPYGIREPTKKIGIERDNYMLSEEHLSNHIPAKVDYGLSHIYTDLLQFSARHLEIGGRLVCWYPLVREDYKVEDLPTHPHLKLIANTEQVLSKLTARRLLTYEKISTPSEVTNGLIVSNLNGSEVSHFKISDKKITTDFRDRYFAVGEITRKERKEKKALDIERNMAFKQLKIEQETDINNDKFKRI